MTNRARLSATIEADVLAAGQAAVARGQAESLSAWVNTALRRQADHFLDLDILADHIMRAQNEAPQREAADA